MTTLFKDKPTVTSVIPSNVWRISVDRYFEMVNSGVLTPADNLELLEGFVVEKMTAKPPHAHIVDLLVAFLIRMLPMHYFVGVQRPFLADDSVPEPDVFVYTGDKTQFFGQHPTSEHTPLLVEVSDATLGDDQKRKKRIYARAGVSEYWIVNIPEQQIEVYTEPGDATFKQIRIFSGADQVPVTLNDTKFGTINIRDIFPQPTSQS